VKGCTGRGVGHDTKNLIVKPNQLTYGIRPVMEAIHAGKEIARVYIKKDLKGDLFRELFQLLRKRSIPYQFVPVEKLNRITRKNHQGVIAQISPVIFQPIEQIVPALFESGEMPFFIVLDGITDVRNIGAIARTAACASVHALILPATGSAQINADAIKTSAGALNTLPVCRSQELVSTIKYLKGCGITIYGASEKVGTLYHQVAFDGPAALVLGAEDTGISEGIMKVCHELVKIPVYGPIASLNVSAAAAVLIFEMIRQRHPSG
jgi:23S rRNA (guanosine2251-2'-O)-methyltransferase